MLPRIALEAEIIHDLHWLIGELRNAESRSARLDVRLAPAPRETANYDRRGMAKDVEEVFTNSASAR
jgi:hypothetical protein